MSSPLTWGTRTLVASGGVGSYSHDNDGDYTFRIYATARRDGRKASLFLEYTLSANNSWAGYSQYTGPHFEFSVDGSVKVAEYVSEIETGTTLTLATYTKELTADSTGEFDTTSVKGQWIRGGTSGWAPKDKTIQDTAVTLADIEPLGLNTKVNGAWKHALCFVKVGGAWKQGLVFTKVSGAWKAGQ